MFTRRTLGTKRAGHQAGFTIVEATIVVSALAILASSATPVISGFVEAARTTRAKSDLIVLGTAIQMYRFDTAESLFYQKGKVNWGMRDASVSVKMLVGNGDMPQVGPDGDPDWAMPYDGRLVDTFQDHLITNTPGYLTSGERAAGSALPSQGGFNAPFAWRGPYVNAPVNSDPWGNRYACNAIYLVPSTGGNDVVLLSAGPDGSVNSGFTKDALVAGGDDMILTVSGGK